MAVNLLIGDNITIPQSPFKVLLICTLAGVGLTIGRYGGDKVLDMFSGIRPQAAAQITTNNIPTLEV